jgi:hypothetical protein
MKPRERDELIATMSVHVEDMHKVIFGNGKPGLYDEFQIVKQNQKHCIEEKEKKRFDFQWAVIVILAIADIYLVFKK